MNLQWVRIYLSVLETGSFAAAARQQHMTQPAVSMAIASLEEQIGQALLLRTPGQRTRVQPTRAGEIFRDYAHRFLEDYNQLRAQLMREQSFVPFSIATSPTPGAVLLPILTNAFRADFPQISYELRAHSGNELIRRLRQGEFDIAITGIPVQDADLVVERFFYDPLELVCPTSMKLGEMITLRQLQKLPLIIRNQKCYTMSLLTESLSRVGMALSDMNVVMQVYGNSDVLQAVSFGSGCGFVTRSLLSTMQNYYDRVKIIPVKKMQIERHLHLVRRRDGSFPSSAQIFWEYALDSRWRDKNFSYHTNPH